jgi:hypothetical protein
MHVLPAWTTHQLAIVDSYTRQSISSIEEIKILSRKIEMASSSFYLLSVLLIMIASGARAMDPSPLQDFCVADKDSPGMYS